jgi:hypothetical protein
MSVDLGQIKFEHAMFYRNEFALRIEVGPDDVDLWLDDVGGRCNRRYFEMAVHRARQVFDTAFSPTDELSVVYQVFSNGRRRISKNCYVLGQIHASATARVKFSKHRDLDSYNLRRQRQHVRRATVSGLVKGDLNIRNLLLAVVNQDFGSRYPSISGKCYFVNHTTGLVLHLYDDRGMDVVAQTRATLLPVYEAHNDLLLNWDRARMDELFANRVG